MTPEPSRIVLVSAATGRQGQAAARALLDHGWRVRALVRHADRPPALALAACGAEIVLGDFDDIASIEAALRGVYGLFLYQPGFMSPELTPGLSADSELTRGRAMISAAVKARIEHLVFSSALGANAGLSPLLAPKQQLERELVASGLPSTIIRPVGFMENYAGPGRGLAPDGTIRTAAPPEIVEQLVAVRDIGVFAALAFANPDRYIGHSFELAGDRLTVPQIAAAMSSVLGGSVQYQQIPIEEIRRTNPERAASLQRLYRLDPPQADLPELRRQHPGLLSFVDWLRAGGAEQVAAYLQPAVSA